MRCGTTSSILLVARLPSQIQQIIYTKVCLAVLTEPPSRATMSPTARRVRIESPVFSQKRTLHNTKRGIIGMRPNTFTPIFLKKWTPCPSPTTSKGIPALRLCGLRRARTTKFNRLGDFPISGTGMFDLYIHFYYHSTNRLGH